MTWCADLTLMLLVATAPAPAGPAAAPSDLEVRVAGEIAARWNAPADAVVLEWEDALPDSAAAAGFRVTGGGSGGRFGLVPDGAPGTIVRFRAGTLDTAWVAARDLTAGSTLVDGDLTADARLRWGPPRARTLPSLQPGWDIRRNVASGSRVAWPVVAPPLAISTGDVVTFTWSQGAVEVSFTGVALNSAHVGETVRASVAGRPRPVAGTAAGPGAAQLTPGGIR